MELRQVSAGGTEFSYFELGKGPLLLCLHGFPDTAHTWLQLMPELSAAGYRVVAPFMRGYAPSAIPADGDYSVPRLGRDALDLATALGAEQFTLIGHDWGAAACYAAANLEPDRICAMATLAVPHPRAMRPGLQLMRTAWHIGFFQLRPLALKTLPRNDFALVDRLYLQWSPNWSVGEEELRPVKQALAAPANTAAALAYYWALASSLVNPARLARSKFVFRRTRVPTVSFVGSCDGALPASLFDRARDAFTGPYECHRLEGAGHFLHREAPDEFLAATLKFFSDQS